MRIAEQKRQVHFRRKWWIGIDARQVQAFLHAVFAELDTLAAEAAVAREENTRLKAALRQWQTAVGTAPVPTPATARHRSTW